MYLFKFFSARNDETCLRCSGEYPRLVPRSERHVDVVAEEAVAGGGRVGGHDDGARLCKGAAVSPTDNFGVRNFESTLLW